MKSHRYLIIFLLLLSISSHLQAQHATELTPGYYLVVGAYAPTRENVAKNYKEILTRKGYDAEYGFNTSRRFFFVYLTYYSTLKESLTGMTNVRKKPEFAQAWVRVVPGDITGPRVVSSNTSQLKTATVIEKKNTTGSETVTTQVIKPAGQKDKEISEHKHALANVEQAIAESARDAKPLDSSVTENPPIQQFNPITLGNTEVFLSLFNATNNRIVEGSVKVIDTERSKLLKDVKGNEYLALPDPKSTTGQLTLICEAFGYRKVQSEINYPLPLADTVKDNIDLMGTTFVINFDLVRYRLGDIATLYNVYFYNDAALMLPESKYELNSLLQMMQENPKYNIRLHGHTNGNYHGRIIKAGASKNFFSLDGSVNTVGSSKDLSYERAEIIKDYLAANGIDPTRVDVKAWGGKRPLFDKHGVNAKRNVRVEVEILAE